MRVVTFACALVVLLPSCSLAGWASSRLTLGGRFTYYWLEDTRRAGENGFDNGNHDVNFLGSLWGLDAEQHAFPNPYAEYRVWSGLGVGVCYDQLRARTLDWANGEHVETAGDGEVEIRGGGLFAFGRYRNRSRFEPFAQAGWAWYRSRFEVDARWGGNGFEVENTNGWFATVGVRAKVARHFSMDISYRHSGVDDVQARANIVGNKYRYGAFPMHHDALAAGVAYDF